MSANYSILVDVDLNTKDTQKKLNEKLKGLKVEVDGGKTLKELDNDASNAAKSVGELGSSLDSTSLTFQAANAIFQKSIDVLGAMVEQVYALNDAQIEFQKVSDLQGKQLDKFISKLSDMGGEVARTGKPKRQAPVDGMVNQQQDSLEIQYSLRAYSTTMVA